MIIDVVDKFIMSCLSVFISTGSSNTNLSVIIGVSVSAAVIILMILAVWLMRKRCGVLNMSKERGHVPDHPEKWATDLCGMTENSAYGNVKHIPTAGTPDYVVPL